MADIGETIALIKAISGQSVAELKSAIQQKYTKPNDGIPASDLASGVIPSVPVQDVQVNGTSILSQGVASVPIATANAPGVAIVDSYCGIKVGSSNQLAIEQATDGEVKAGAHSFNPIVPNNQHKSVFYGLAKVAGNTDQSSSSNAVGTYTDDAKLKIQQMLGLYTPKKYIKYTLQEEASSIDSTNLPMDDVEINIYEELVIMIYQSDTSQNAYGSNDYGHFQIRDVVNSGYIAVGSMYLKTTGKCSIMRIKRLPSCLVAELINNGSTYTRVFPRSADYVDKVRWIAAGITGGTYKAGATIEAYVSRIY